MTNPFKKKYVVYVAWQGDVCLYVGMSSRGMVRPLTNPKLQLYRSKITKIDMHDCKSKRAALLMESEFTYNLSPILEFKRAGRPKKEKTVIIYTRVPDSLSNKLRSSAVKDGRELSGQVRHIIEEHYAKKG